MKKILVVVIAIVAALGAALWSLGYFPGKPSEKLAAKGRDVVVIVIDTLRADHLPIYGYPVDTSPFLTKLSQRSVVFNNAIAGSSWTAPSVASMFTSQYPSEHGVITGFVVRRNLLARDQTAKFNKLAASQFTLPKYFQSIGYQTIGVADNLNISEELGFNQGFDRLVTIPYLPADTVNSYIEKELNNRKKDKPLFLYIQYIDPHAPYHPRAPWYKPSKDKKKDVIRRYDSEIAYVDHEMEKLFEKFPELHDALIVVTADHGEQFWEHGKRGHGKSLHRPEIQVPLFFAHPELKRQYRVDNPVSGLDLLPTLAALTGGEHHPTWRGVSLVPIMDGAKTAREGAFSELLFHHLLAHREQFRSLVTASHHIIKLLGESPAYTTFDWNGDKLEQNGTAVAHDSFHAKLVDKFEQSRVIADQETIEKTFTPEEIQRLETMGYVQ